MGDFTYPAAEAVIAADPVETEVEGYDERGDIKEVRHYVNGTLVTDKVRSRSSSATRPPAGAVGARP